MHTNMLTDIISLLVKVKCKDCNAYRCANTHDKPPLSWPQVETIGDTYMLVAGLPKRLHLTHAALVAESALALMKASQYFRIPHMPDSPLKLRVGMHSGTDDPL